jgi:ElaB/YqjD/DUF883 family membrane-anchored ribosome-binding protein
MTNQKSAKAESDSEAELAKQVEQLKADFAELSELLKKVGLEKGEDLRDDVQKRAREYAEMGRRQAEKLSGAASDLEADITAHIRDKPMQSLIMAALIGFVFGLLSRRS